MITSVKSKFHKLRKWVCTQGLFFAWYIFSISFRYTWYVLSFFQHNSESTFVCMAYCLPWSWQTLWTNSLPTDLVYRPDHTLADVLWPVANYVLRLKNLKFETMKKWKKKIQASEVVRHSIFVHLTCHYSYHDTFSTLPNTTSHHELYTCKMVPTCLWYS